MIVVLTPNPAVDVTYRVAAQRVGTTQRVLDVARRPGGKGVNVARVLHGEGVPTRPVLPVGGASGEWLTATLRGLGFDPAPVPVAGETRTTVTVVDDVAHPTMFGEPGPAVSAAEWDEVRAALAAALPGASAFVVSGSLPVGTDADRAGDWVATARDAGVLTVADLAGPALLAAAAAGASVCGPNLEELLTATGAATEAEGAADLLTRGAGAVVVSRGAGGLAAHTRDGVLEVPAVPGVTGNPTGAGDAATAGLTLALTTGRPLEAALRRAAAFGAAAVLRPTAGEIDRDAAARFLAALETPLGSPT